MNKRKVKRNSHHKMPTQLSVTRNKKENINLLIAKRKGKDLRKSKDKIPNKINQDQSSSKKNQMYKMRKSKIRDSEDSSIVIWRDQQTKVFLDLRRSNSL